MGAKVIGRSLFLIQLALLVGCAPARAPIPAGTVPEPRAVTISEEQYGHQVLEQLSERYKLDYSDPRLAQVNRVVDRLTAAAHANKEPWHVYLFKAPEVRNAAATRGNHVFVWSGILNLAKSDEELATILSHEISHVLAGHTDPDPNEQVKRILIGVGAVAAGIAVSAATAGTGAGTVDVGNITAAMTQEVGSGVLLSPYSREREFEADQIGIFLMADAGYDPAQCVAFWERARTLPDFSNSIDFLSSHPSADDRLAKLRTFLPQARERYLATQGGAKPPKNSYAASAAPGVSSSSTTPPPRSPTPTLATQPTATPVPQSSPSQAPSASAGERFDWNDRPDLTAPTPTPDPRWPNRAIPWEVAAGKAILYSSPEATSKAIGEFKGGAIVRGFRRSAYWVEVYTPDHGFLRIEDLAPPIAAPRQ